MSYSRFSINKAYKKSIKKSASEAIAYPKKSIGVVGIPKSLYAYNPDPIL